MFHRHHRHAHYGRRGGRRGGCGAPSWHEGGGFGAAFGVKRPLRYLAYKLDLDDEQTGELAKVLKELKTERAQAEVDNQRAIGGIADALAADAFDKDKAKEAVDARVESAKRVQEQVLAALEAIHEILEPEQREQLSYLIRTGSLSI